MLKRFYLLLFGIMALITVVVNSCKKDNHAEQLTNVTDPAIVEAKSWYESTYPVSISNSKSNLKTQAIEANTDWSQLTKPDWRHNASYTRFNKKGH